MLANVTPGPIERGDAVTTLLYVHGTGVRGAAYEATLKRIQRSAQLQGLPVSVLGCFWGAAHGAVLRAGGRSIPGYIETGGQPPTYADEQLALWSVLYTDPLYELRLLRHMPSRSTQIGQQTPKQLLLCQLNEFVPSADLVELLAQAGLTPHFDEALTTIRTAPEFDQAAGTAPTDPLEHRQAIARAIIAHALVSVAAFEPPLDGASRDALVRRLTDELGGYGLGIGGFLAGPLKGLAAHLAARKRGAISDAVSPTAGDILHYLADGDGARELIARRVADIRGPTCLLGHSLGGIMCVDLLIRAVIPNITGLVTVGSQAPLLYEIGALPSLSYPDPLPEHFPPWLNIYDRRDLLAYVGAEVLGERVTDVGVDNREPFPRAHGAYWSNKAVWQAIESFVR